MKSNSPGVIVIGGHVQGLGIIRIFGENRIPTILLDDTGINIARFSKYCSHFYKYKKNQLLDFLNELSQMGNYKNWLLIPTNDYHVKVLSQNHNLLSKSFKISTDTWESISKCYNKINTYKIAKEINIDIPKTLFPNSIEELKFIEINYPCIIKPAIMHEFYSKLKKKVFICNNLDELKLFYSKALEIIPADQIIIQEIIYGSSENQYSSCFLFLNGKVITSLTARRKRQHPIDFGNATTFAETIDLPEIKEVGQKLLSKINYNGICEVEFKQDEKTGEYKFLEINPRSWKWHSISQKAGVPFLINLYNHYYNLPFVNNESIDYPIGWKHIVTDFPTVIKLILKNQFIKSKCKKTQYAVWNKKDLLPAIFELILLPFLIFKR